MKYALAAVMTLVLQIPFAHAHGPGQSQPAKSAVLAAGVESVNTFAAEFSKSTGQEVGARLLGFTARAASDDVLAGVYNQVSQTQTAKDNYDCHFHGEHAHCEFTGTKDTFEFASLPHTFTPADIEASANEAAALFAKTADPALIEKAKFWLSADSIEVALKWTPKGQAEKAVYMMCHYHGKHIDCHRQSRPGPNEPQD